MDNLDFVRSKSLNNVPHKKVLERLSAIENSQDDLQTKNIKLTAINRYAESNIPIEYWNIKMEKDFQGDSRLLDKYNEYVSDLKMMYYTGNSICFAGNHGVGKSFAATSILKKACQKGYSCLYTDFSNIVSVLISSPNEERFFARRELSLVDFLVIDEVDPRFISTSDNAIDLFARNLESIFRTRSQNKLPTIMCTNSPNLLESFHGALKDSLGSLMKGYLQMFPVFGTDFRTKNKGDK